MGIQLGKVIKGYRIKRELTQEQLAAELKVSFQSISKWEREEAMPDIEKLIQLSLYFGVSVDELLGLKTEGTEEISKKITEMWNLNRREGRHKENEILLKEQLECQPFNYLLMIQLANTMEELAEQEKDNLVRYLRESIRLYSIIIENCTEPEYVNAARYNICFSYWRIGEKEKAIEMAQNLPGYYKSRENALVFLCEPTQKVKIAKESLDPITWAMVKHLLIIDEAKGGHYKHLAEIILEQLAPDISSDLYVRLRKEVEK